MLLGGQGRPVTIVGLLISSLISQLYAFHHCVIRKKLYADFPKRDPATYLQCLSSLAKDRIEKHRKVLCFTVVDKPHVGINKYDVPEYYNERIEHLAFIIVTKFLRIGF